MKRFLHNQKGSVLIIVALGMVAFMGMAAMSIDLGTAYVTKSNLQKAADAAALAGVRDMSTITAVTYAVKNLEDPPETTITNPMTLRDGITKVTATSIGTNQIKVDCTTNIQTMFAKVFLINHTAVRATATAYKGGITDGISGVRPWAIFGKYEVVGGTNKNPTSTWVDYTYGLEFTVKEGGGDGENGSFGIYRFGDQKSGNNINKLNITNGYDGIVKIGDTIYDDSGNKASKKEINELMTKSGDTDTDSYNYTNAPIGDSRVVIIPRIDANYKVIGFVVIYLDSVDNKASITGHFLYDTTWSEVQKASHSDWGLNSKVKLIE